jgi:hypothetical protein
MNINHPAETEVQLYAMDKSACSPTVAEHIESCVICLEEVKTYRLVFSEIHHVPKPAFDFDLSQIVLDQLPYPKPRLSADQFIAGFLLVFVGCFIGIPVILFNHYILNMFSGIPPFFIYAIIGSAAVILLYKTIALYKKFLTQLEKLNFN